MKKEKEPNVWWTTLKLVLIAVCLIGGVGLALWWAYQNEQLDNPNRPPPTSSSTWGIANDSPIRPKR